MDDQVFDEVMGQTFGAPSTTLNGSGAATAVMDPETAGWVTEDPVSAPVDEPAPQASGASPESFESGAGNQGEQQNPWDSDENPYKLQALNAQQRINQSVQYLQTLQMQQQMAEYDAALQARIEQLPELDPEQQAMAVRQIVAEREAARDMAYQQMLYQKEQQAEQLARNQVIQTLAARNQLTKEEVAAMSAMNDPWRMEQYAKMASSARANAMQEVEQLRARLNQYESGQAARQRMASGADRVGVGQATSAAGRPSQPKTFDEFWDQWVGN